MSKFIKELKRRNVIKSTIAYLVIAWIIIQVATAVLPTFGAADWVNQAIIIVLAVGLPIWIIISWIYDITPEGIEKTPEEAEKHIHKELINKRTNAFIIVSLTIAVVIMGLKISGVFDTNNQYAIAVLPFVNMSDDKEQEYFSDGISEEMINMLAQVPSLKVLGRTSSFSFKGKEMDVKLIGEQLNVTHILEGSVRKSGNTLRINAKLINVADGSQLFSETFDRQLVDVFDIQDEISQKVLSTIKIKLLGEEKEAVLKKYTDNIEAYEQYLKGRFHLNKMTPDGFLKAIEFFNKAIAIDEAYAAAYSEIAFCYMNLRDFMWLPIEQSQPQALKDAEKAIELDDQIAESQLADGRIKFHWQWNVRDALAAFKKAVALNPNNPQAHVQLAFCLVHYERFEEAIKHATIAKNLDPLSVLNLWYVNAVFFSTKDYEICLSIAKNIIDLEPNNYLGHQWAAFVYFKLGQYDAALAESEMISKLGFEEMSLIINGMVFAKQGDKTKAMEIIEEFKKRKLISHEIGDIYAFLGDLDNAFIYYNRAVEDREVYIMWIKFHFTTSEVLSDPRFKDLHERMNIIY